MIPVAAAFFVLAACQQKLEDPRSGACTDVPVQFSVTTGIGAATRTTFTPYVDLDWQPLEISARADGHERINWEDGDKFVVYCKDAVTDRAVYTVDCHTVADYGSSFSNTSLAEVSSAAPLLWNTEGNYSFYGLYPAPDDDLEIVADLIDSGGTVTAKGNIYFSQILKSDFPYGYAYFGADLPQYGYMYAVTSGHFTPTSSVPLVFKPLMTVFEFSLWHDEEKRAEETDAHYGGRCSINKLELISNDAGTGVTTPLSGDFEATLSAPDVYSTVTCSDTRNYIWAFNSGMGGGRSMTLARGPEYFFVFVGLPVQQTCLSLKVTYMDGSVVTLDLKDGSGEWITVNPGEKLNAKVKLKILDNGNNE